MRLAGQTFSGEEESAVRYPLRVLMVTWLLNAVGCATISMSPAVAPVSHKAHSDLPQDYRLDVAVLVFDAGLPPDGQTIPEGVYPHIRSAEARLIPLMLQRTLEATEHWGSVSLLPAEPAAADVTVSGKILLSDGRDLRLLVRAKDSSGRTWFEKKYRTRVPVAYYVKDDDAPDPYQRMFNTIANEMVEARSKLDLKEVEEIETIAELKFASDLSPEALGGYLMTDDDGDVEIVRLPALDDPMMERALEVRLRDEMFLDTIGIHFENFASRIESNYWHWRESSSQEIRAKEALRREQVLRGIATGLLVVATAVAAANGNDAVAAAAVVTGSVLIQQQIQEISALGQQKEMHEEGLRELGQSFQAEAQPMVVELDATSVRLTGTAEAQYQEWKRLLRDLYRAEADVVADLYMVPRQPTEEVLMGESVLPPVSAQSPAALQ